MTDIYKKLRPWLVPVFAILVIIFGTALLVAFAQGYTFDATTGQIKSTGLVLVNSNPGGANVYIDSKDTHKKTPYRYTNAAAGTINVLIKKAGFRDWYAKLLVTAGEVTFSDYAILLPNQLYQQNLAQPVNYNQILQSTDQKHSVALSKDKKAIYSVNNDGEAKPLISAEQDSNIIEFSNIIISPNGERIIFNQSLQSGQIQTLTLKLADGKTGNITSQLSIPANSDLRFNPADTNEIFWLSDRVIKKIKLSELSLSATIISNVATYSVADDRLLIVESKINPTDKTQQLVSYNFSGSDRKIISSTQSDAKGYQLSFIKSRYNEYATIVHNTDGLFELIRNPYSDQNQTISKEGIGISYIATNPNSRFIILSQGGTMKTIDLEFSQRYSSHTNIGTSDSIKWLDSYHLIIQTDNQLRMVDFDGQNNQLLTPIADVVAFSINADNKSILPLNSNGQLFKLWLTKK